MRKCIVYINHPAPLKAEIAAQTLDLGDDQASAAARYLYLNFNARVLTDIFMLALTKNFQGHVNFQQVALNQKNITLMASPAFHTALQEKKFPGIRACELSYE